jgi:HSP90 family molecular chaperone
MSKYSDHISLPILMPSETADDEEQDGDKPRPGALRPVGRAASWWAVERIRSSATKRMLSLLKDLAEKEPGKYARFWREFGAVLKEGVVDDYANRDDIARLLRFTSTGSAGSEQDVSLGDYVARMKEGQEKIYYLQAPSRSKTW